MSRESNSKGCYNIRPRRYLEEGPINHGPVTEEDWLGKACPVVQQRIARYAASEIRFNLMVGGHNVRD